jgi:hypothetical protein
LIPRVSGQEGRGAAWPTAEGSFGSIRQSGNPRSISAAA